MFSDGKRLETVENSLIYLPKCANYVVEDDEPGDCYAINFELSEEVAFSPFCRCVKNPAAVLPHFRQAQAAWNKRSPGYRLKCQAALYEVLYAMVAEYHAENLPNEKYARIKPAVEYIYRTYTEGIIRIEALAEMCGITPEYFRKIFKAYYGVSPLRYIHQLKIAYAQELIESGLYSITAAAYRSGYTDLSHFSREFKKITGESPKAYGSH